MFSSCINTNYNQINYFIALMKSNSYQNIKKKYPFVKYGFLADIKLNVHNQIINYCKNDNDVIGYLPSLSNLEPSTKPNCLDNNLIEK